MATNDAMNEQPVSDEDLEAFFKAAVSSYAYDVLANNNCTPEWEACAHYVLKELVP